MRNPGRLGLTNLPLLAAVGAYLGVSECYTELIRSGNDSPHLALPRLHRWLLIGAGFLLLGSWATYGPGLPRTSGERPVREQLVNARAAYPSVRGRLTGGFVRSPQADASVSELRQILRTAEREQQRSPSPRARADLAIVQLFASEPEKALGNLETAARDSQDPSILSDLAVLLIDGTPRERIRGLGLARQASAGSDQVEPHCNFALALEDFGLRLQAREEWERCRAFDDGLGWAQEADHHLDRLARPTELEAWTAILPQVRESALRDDLPGLREQIDPFRQRARLHVEERELPEWAEAMRAHRLEEARAHLQVARSIGAALKSLHGDSMIADSVAAIDEAGIADPGRLASLVAGHLAYGRGLDSFRRQSTEGAVGGYETAASELQKGRSPFRGWALFRSQLARFLSGATGESVLSALKEWSRELPEALYPILEARRLTLGGMANSRRAHFAESTRGYQDALKRLERLGERELQGSLHYMLAENLKLQGDEEGYWEHALPALSLLHTLGDSVFFDNILMDAADVALHQGAPHTSLLFHEERVRRLEVEAEDNHLDMAEALERRSRALLELGDLDAARRDLEDSLKHADRLMPGRWQDRMRSEAYLALGELELRTDPRRALESLTFALEASLGSRMRYRLPTIYGLRAAAFEAIGDAEAARGDLGRAIDEVETQRAEALSKPTGSTAFDQARRLYETMIRLQADQDPAAAFEFSERSRARTLLDLISDQQGARVLSVTDVRAMLPPSMAMVELAVFQDRTLAWVLTGDGLRMVTLDTGDVVWQSLSDELRSALTRGGNAGPPARELYRRLIEPLKVWIGDRDLVVIPDRALHLVPLAALVNPSTEQYLLQERAVAKSPSATVWVKASQKAQQLGRGAPASVLAIGDPDFDRILFGTKESLRFAEWEAREVASLYPGTRPLLGADATRSAFLEDAPASDIVSIAAHALTEEENPLLSALLLAREEGDPGALYAHEIYRMDFSRTRLVVLSACGTATGAVSASEGTGSLARAFLAAGVPAVVGSLWNAQDQASTDVLVEFHRRLSHGEDPLSALRAAQLALLQRSGPKATGLWAGFEWIGGMSPR